MARTVLVSCLLAVTCGIAAATEILHTAQEVRRITREESRTPHRVVLSGVVTFIDRERGLMFVQDRTGGIFVDDAANVPVEAGDFVGLRGDVAYSDYAPEIAHPQVRRIGKGRFPRPVKVRFDDLTSTRQDSQFVTMQGIVRSVSEESVRTYASPFVERYGNSWTEDAPRGRLRLDLAAGVGRVAVYIKNFDRAAAESLIDCNVEVTGVVATSFNLNNQTIGWFILLDSLRTLRVQERSSADPFSESETPISSLLKFNPRGNPEHRVKVRGVVTFRCPGKAMYVQDASGSIRVESRDASPAEVGEEIDVAGFAAIGATQAVLQDGIYRRTQNRAAAFVPVPLPIDSPSLVRTEHNAELVRLRGTLIGSYPSPGEIVLVVSNGETIFQASVPEGRHVDIRSGIPKLGSLVQLTGVVETKLGERDEPRDFHLLMRTLADIVVLRKPAWWSIRHAVFLSAGLLAAVLVAFLWVIVLRRRVEEKTELVRATLDSTADGVLMANSSGRILNHNRKFVAMWQLASPPNGRCYVDDLVGRRLSDPAAILQIMMALTEDPKVDRTDVLELADGRIVECHSEPERVNGRMHGRVWSFRDITSERRVAAEIIRARDEAQLANRAKSEFLANMSHEIRTPMNGVVGMIELALATELTATQQECLTTAKSSAEVLLTVVNDLLDFSKIDAGRLELENTGFSLRDTLTETVRLLTPSASAKGIGLDCEVDQRIPELVRGDSVRLRQVLLNLVGNAIKFTHEGEVVLSAAIEPISAAGVAVLFSIRDTGIGVPPHQRDHIFQPFTQADTSITRRFGGTGLGLAIASRLVAMMGGRIWVEAASDHGSIFHFTAVFGAAAQGADDALRLCKELTRDAATHSTPATGSRSLSILVAEDNAINQRVAVRMLEKLGHAATVVCSGTAAIQASRENRFDAILMDVQMPEMDGLEATSAIRRLEQATGEHIPIVAMTAHALKAHRDDCIAAGMDASLTKPVLINQLAEVLDAVTGNVVPPRSKA
jgi:signal transduction histidine kinase/CheY-like chemotaxis protein